MIISLILRMLFYPGVAWRFSDEEIKEFDDIYEEALSQGGLITYESQYPKFRFLQYLSSSRDVLFHGSSNKEIHEFLPRRQTLFDGQYVNAVFATSDGIWPFFYAVFNKNKLIGNFRNGCFEANNNKRFYFFSLTKETLENDPWTDGIVYILPRKSFDKAGRKPIIFDEWICKEAIRPLLKLEVNTSDFIFINKVSKHSSQESVFKTWMLYKFRTSFGKKSKRTGNDVH